MLSKKLIIFSSLLTILLLLTAPEPATAQWFPQASPTTNDLKAIAYQGAEKVFICGAKGTLLKKTFSQSDWQTIDLATQADVNDLVFPANETGYLVGDSGVVFKTEKGGRVWQKLSIPTQKELISVSFADSTVGWIAGQDGLILKTIDGGESWQILTQGKYPTIRKILFLNQSLGWAVGDSGLILKSRDGGVTWQQQESGFLANFYDLAFVDSLQGLIVGADSLLLTTSDGGATWQQQNVGVSGDLYAAQAVDSLTWWLGGSGTAYGSLIKSFTGGKVWKAVESSLLQDIYDVNFKTLYRGYAAGKSGRIYYTETAGISLFQQLPLTAPQEGVHGISLTPTFHWQTDGDARAYQLQLADDAQFNHVLIDSTIDGTTFELSDSLDFFTVYYWRVRSRTVIGPGLWSAVRSLRTAQAPPALVSPANQQGDVPVTPLLQWTPTDAGHYEIEIARDAAFTHLVLQETVAEAAFRTPRLNYDNKYYWRVKSVYEDETSAWSETFSFTTLNGLNGWVAQFSGSNQLLKDVTFIDNQNGWAVGTAGTILKTTSGGADWLPCNSGTSYNLESVYFFNKQRGVACGWNGTILTTANGGLSWQTMPTSTSFALRSIAFSSDSIGWAVGENGVILKSTDGGANWTEFSTNPNQEYYQILFIDADHGWIAGGAWNGHDYSPLIMETKNGGQNWNALPFAGDGILRSVFFISPDSGWVAGRQGQIFRTLNGGMSWLIQQGDKNYNLRALFFQSPSTGWAVGDNGVCLKTENSGQTWSPQQTGNPSALADIYFSDTEHGWIVGGHGAILKTASAGLNLIPTLSEPQNHSLGLARDLTLRWLPVSGASSYYVQVADDSMFSHLIYENGNIFTNEIFLSGLEQNRTYFWRVKSFHEGKISDWSPARNFLTEGVWKAQFSTTRQNLNDIIFKDLYSGIAVGDGGTILRTADGGETWKQLPLISTANLNTVCRPTDNIYWAAGDSGTLLQSTDDGQSWQQQILADKALLQQIVFTSENEGWVGGYTHKDQQQVAVLAHTTDGGQNWQLTYLDSLHSIQALVFLDDIHGFAAGQGANANLLHTSDGGQTWTAAQTKVSSAIQNLLFIDVAHGYLSAVDGSFYTSADSGYTWTKVGRPDSAPSCDMFFIDSLNGFVLANGLFRTTDGGQNWQRYFADSLFNKIFFIDQNTGWLLGDRGLILKTTSAGAPLALENGERKTLPEKFELRQNFPNPFNPSTTISYTVGGPGRSPVNVRLTVYNALGQVVKVLINQKQMPGEYRLRFNADNLASGVYIYRLQSAGYSKARKLILLR